ncbi:MAG: hypothetical protein K6D94_03830 [Clostridiales bacterium]|nr:hypothetical protein [Clostridiales bacterium]
MTDIKESEETPGQTTLYPDGMPEDLRFDGGEVKFLINQQYSVCDLIGEDSGDIVDSEVYHRNQRVGERFGVKIDVEASDLSHSELADKVRRSVMAGDHGWDVYLARGPEGAELSLEGLLLSVTQLPRIDIDQLWWNKNYTENMAININDLQYLVGDINMSVFKSSNAVFFNKEDFNNRFGDYEKEIYGSVLDGKWIYDVFMTYVAASYEDLNGSGNVDINDHFGIVYLDYAQDWYISSAGITFMSRDSEGFPVLQLYNDNTVKFCEYLQKLFSTPEYGWCYVGEQLDMGNMFKSRNALFLPGRFTYVDGNLRDMEDPYGVIPYPKVTEDMDYMSASGHSGNFVTVPIGCADPDMVSAVLEAMAAESHMSVFPVYYETALKIKYTDGGIDADMIDLIHDCMNFYVTSNVFINGERIGTILQDVVMTNKEFASEYESQIRRKEELLKELIAQYTENHAGA